MAAEARHPERGVRGVNRPFSPAANVMGTRVH